MNARDKFTIGQSVILTPEARDFEWGKRMVRNGKDEGVVTGFCKSPLSIKVKYGRNKVCQVWPMEQWEPKSPHPGE